MLLVECPWCGPRDQTEFACRGEAHISRPDAPANIDDEAWCEYLFLRTNPKGRHAERWIHVHGCGRWFNAVRDTVTDRFIGTYKIGAAKPDITP